MGTPMQNANARALNDVKAMCVLELRRGFTEAIRAQGTAVFGQMRAMAAAFGRSDRGAFQDIHQRVGDLAQDSVLRAYDQLVTAREGPASRTHYRAGANRQAGGVLRRALGNGNFFEATPDGLRWVNVAMLDTEARHWHRVNFGAAGRGEGSTAQFDVRYGNLVVGALGYSEGPSPPFAVPRGVWINMEGGRVKAGANPRGADAFYPQGQRPPGIFGAPTRRRTSAGIEEKNFLDAGLARIAREFPRAYEQRYEQIYGKLLTGQRKISIKAPTPRRLPISVSRFD